MSSKSVFAKSALLSVACLGFQSQSGAVQMRPGRCGSHRSATGSTRSGSSTPSLGSLAHYDAEAAPAAPRRGLVQVYHDYRQRRGEQKAAVRADRVAAVGDAGFHDNEWKEVFVNQSGAKSTSLKIQDQTNGATVKVWNGAKLYVKGAKESASELRTRHVGLGKSKDRMEVQVLIMGRAMVNREAYEGAEATADGWKMVGPRKSQWSNNISLYDTNRLGVDNKGDYELNVDNSSTKTGQHKTYVYAKRIESHFKNVATPTPSKYVAVDFFVVIGYASISLKFLAQARNLDRNLATRYSKKENYFFTPSNPALVDEIKQAAEAQIEAAHDQ